MINLPLYWWYIPIFFFIFPIIIASLEENKIIDNNWLGMVLVLICWPIAATICIIMFVV
jgi:hypothetical protein